MTCATCARRGELPGCEDFCHETDTDDEGRSITVKTAHTRDLAAYEHNKAENRIALARHRLAAYAKNEADDRTREDIGIVLDELAAARLKIAQLGSVMHEFADMVFYQAKGALVREG